MSIHTLILQLLSALIRKFGNVFFLFFHRPFATFTQAAKNAKLKVFFLFSVERTENKKKRAMIISRKFSAFT